MLFTDLTSSGALPALEASLRFAAQRQRLIAHNIANISTPEFIPADASPRSFQVELSEAVTRRREETGGEWGDLDWRDTGEVARGADGRLSLTPRTPSGNILFHDRNNRDLERLMQAQAENAAVFRVASELIRTRFDLLRSAIAQRV